MSLFMLRRASGIRIIPLSHVNAARPFLRPQYIAARGCYNPLDGDYMELSETAWKEKRLYRYYKFSNNLSVKQQQRGYAAGIFVLGVYVISFFVLGFIDYETCVQYRPFRQWRAEVRNPWLEASGKEGYFYPWSYSKAKAEEMYDVELPAIAAKHDAPTKRAWNKNMCLTECLKRDKDFDSPYHFHSIDHALVPMAHPAYLRFVEEGNKELAIESE